MRAARVAALGLVLAVARPAGGGEARPLPRARPEESAEFLRLRQALGTVLCQDNRVLFARPYDREALRAILARVCGVEGSVPGRQGFAKLLTRVIQFAEVPPADLREIVRPALAPVVERLERQADDDPRLATLANDAAVCLWNLDYALAAAEIERLRQEGRDPSASPAATRIEELERTALQHAKAKKTYWVGSLVTWALRLDLDAAAEEIAALATEHKHHWRVGLAQEELRLRRALRGCRSDDERVALLIQAARDRDNPIPLQGWAIRTLSQYPTEQAIEFLSGLYSTPEEENERPDLSLEAQEALRRLGKIPQEERRYADYVERRPVRRGPPRPKIAPEVVEHYRLKRVFGHVCRDDGVVLFPEPYRREELERLVARACGDGEPVTARLPLVSVLADVLRFAQVPTADLEGVVRPALERALATAPEMQGTADDRYIDRLLEKTRRCWWNLRYALAFVQLRELQAQGKDPAEAKARLDALEEEALRRRTSRHVSLTLDLLGWYLRADLATAEAKVADLAAIEPHDRWVRIAQEKLRLRRAVETRGDDDRRVALLIQAARDKAVSRPVQQWAVRTLAEYPTEAALRFLAEQYSVPPREHPRCDLGLEAQEALRRLGKIPQDAQRFLLMP